jgi:transcriptional regulator with XRE-family HTH domain
MKLNDWLTRENMTKTELCMRLNINRSLISLWKNGKRRIGPKTLKELKRITQGEVNHVDDVRND